MNINDMKRKDFEALPLRKWDEETECDSIVILPGNSKDIHDSGYRCMTFVAVKNTEAVCRLTDSSDVLHLDGIGGYGYRWLEKYGMVPTQIPPSGWTMDCMPKNGLLRIWPNSGRILCGNGLSSFQVFALDK